mmetsp:Transcript_2142/g.5677  ORF Transcript_2142/g.5677 Transcript_2142/m.5677 type:complete len:141 (-) Transcript_2142:1206-1628(-)
MRRGTIVAVAQVAAINAVFAAALRTPTPVGINRTGHMAISRRRQSLLSGPSPMFSAPPGTQETESRSDDDDDNETIDAIQNQLTYIEALEARNKAQLGSFVDEEDQWESLEDFERELLLSKEDLTVRLEELLTQRRQQQS